LRLELLQNRESKVRTEIPREAEGKAEERQKATQRFKPELQA